MGDNFMTAISKIEDLVTKQTEILKRAGSYIADAIHTRIFSTGIEKNGYATERDIRNAIKDFPDADKVGILVHALVQLSIKFSAEAPEAASSNKNKKKKSSDWF